MKNKLFWSFYMFLLWDVNEQILKPEFGWRSLKSKTTGMLRPVHVNWTSFLHIQLPLLCQYCQLRVEWWPKRHYQYWPNSTLIQLWQIYCLKKMGLIAPFLPFFQEISTLPPDEESSRVSIWLNLTPNLRRQSWQSKEQKERKATTTSSNKATNKVK